jgi:hypothetical protein
LDEQVSRFARGEQVEGQAVGSGGRHQTGELVAAGDQDQASGCAGQQRADLRGVSGVVQHDEHAFVREGCPVERLLRVPIDRDPLRRDPERVEEPADRVGRVERRRARVEAA